MTDILITGWRPRLDKGIVHVFAHAEQPPGEKIAQSDAEIVVTYSDIQEVLDQAPTQAEKRQAVKALFYDRFVAGPLAPGIIARLQAVEAAHPRITAFADEFPIRVTIPG